MQVCIIHTLYVVYMYIQGKTIGILRGYSHVTVRLGHEITGNSAFILHHLTVTYIHIYYSKHSISLHCRKIIIIIIII